jgi:hypothetical protein
MFGDPAANASQWIVAAPNTVLGKAFSGKANGCHQKQSKWETVSRSPS